ncbi:bifunctional 4-hydroxy-2-oxoglutarate aldolase/2-dehydro-3-deoxy-phosphogluconate aldolase [Actinomadura parmotrematis]|uniref:Bifunctional 4-hydroxy-2-oxoglutarate aldolase/2-dehydro-3-deoxy-phosphogluconate aldolase n=1 Tax=Actinomadura parmotrematis TaxID=2864039 RepID=A0ABS7G202_9ACTN|nr:bifunctional 4-hydroxy-2-oxoglutarate aldolase/2-dehydro-3-deoxy-phosphogluconate aldolase [Actinomadura parmotrematis]MBW8486734.1 bifunctional 4-hydroxy-2-oxoglutarate aldolase/2-dehydro-3-deoxy-phosphogluconate aldolase [Actinomadura parmotrematis]
MTRHPAEDADALAARLREDRLLPVLRTASAARLVDSMLACRRAGLRVLELTTTTPDWSRVLAEAAADARFAGTLLGVGTVTTAAQAEQAVAAGARFLVSPYAAPEARAAAGGVPFLEGAFSPTEVARAAHRAGPGGIVKLYPAGSVGPSHLRALRDVLPGLSVVPTGGVTPQTAASWLDAGALAVGIGGALAGLGADGIADLGRRLRKHGAA